MTVVVLALTAFAVFAIAAVAIGRFTFGSAQEARQAVFDLDEAVEWVADRLPPDLQARMSHEDVRSLLGWYLDELEGTGVAYERDEERLPDDGGEPVVVQEDEVAARVLERAELAGVDCSDVDVLLVIDETVGYLRAIGAVGHEAAERPARDP